MHEKLIQLLFLGILATLLAVALEAALNSEKSKTLVAL
ncbi:MAG: hypothetical protein ACJAQT_002698 [Akkermansiaceae bacterium]|jgi:hypothetical protein